MNLNLSKLCKEIEGSKFSKAEIASNCGIDRKTIENVLAGRDPKLSTIVSLASFLGIRISYLFDEDIEIKEAGRDYVERGNIEHSGPEYNGPVTEMGTNLVLENAELKQKLIEAQEKIIRLMEGK